MKISQGESEQFNQMSEGLEDSLPIIEYLIQERSIAMPLKEVVKLTSDNLV